MPLRKCSPRTLPAAPARLPRISPTVAGGSDSPRARRACWHRCSRAPANRMNSPGHRCRSGFNGGEQLFARRRLDQKGKCPRAHGFRANRRIIPAGQENHPRRWRNFPQPRLRLEAIHPWHPYIQHRHPGMVCFRMAQKRLGVFESRRLPARRAHQPSRGSQHRRIVIEKTNGQPMLSRRRRAATPSRLLVRKVERYH